MHFAEADVADQDDVGLGCDEGQTEQVPDLRAVDLFGPTLPTSLVNPIGILLHHVEPWP
jgi:hypothetical protein